MVLKPWVNRDTQTDGFIVIPPMAGGSVIALGRTLPLPTVAGLLLSPFRNFKINFPQSLLKGMNIHGPLPPAPPHSSPVFLSLDEKPAVPISIENETCGSLGAWEAQGKMFR